MFALIQGEYRITNINPTIIISRFVSIIQSFAENYCIPNVYLI